MPVFFPPRGGRGSQSKPTTPVPSAYWQPPEHTKESPYWRYQDGAIFLGWLDDVPIGVKSDRHLMTVAGARAGKTSTLLIPNLLLYRGSSFVIDPKGELASATAQHRKEVLEQDVYVLDPWGTARDCPHELRAQFDPLAELFETKTDDLIDDASLMAEALILDEGRDSQWTNAARDFVRAVILYMIFGSERERANLAQLLENIVMSMGDGPILKVMQDFEPPDDCPRDVAELIKSAGQSMLDTPDKERNSILSTARNQLGFLSSTPMIDSLDKSSLRLRDLKRKPVTVYLCLPAARMSTHAKWMRLILNMTMAALEVEQTKPELPVLFMLEEFAALGHMRALEQGAAYMAGFDVKLFIVLQDLTQLKRHYKEGWETFIGNLGVFTAFGNTDQTTLEYVSKRLGETFTYISETVRQGTGAATSGAPATRENFQKVPLLAPHEIAQHFGRRKMSCLCLPADGPPIGIERRFVEENLQFCLTIEKALLNRSESLENEA